MGFRVTVGEREEGIVGFRKGELEKVQFHIEFRQKHCWRPTEVTVRRYKEEDEDRCLFSYNWDRKRKRTKSEGGGHDTENVTSGLVYASKDRSIVIDDSGVPSDPSFRFKERLVIEYVNN